MSEKNTEIRISNVNPSTKQDLINIASNLGVDLSPFLKIKLKDVADSYPIDMKKKKK